MPDSETIADQVQIIPDKDSYMASEKILLSITNRLDQPITALNQQTYCSIIILEKQTNTGWQPVKNCISESPSLEITINAGSSATAELASGPQSLGNIVAGHYRARLIYTIGAHFKPSQTHNVFSDLFAVQ